jgi:maleate isomerase
MASEDRAGNGRLRIGMLLPSVNTVAEPQIGAMLPAGVSLHTTRLKLSGGSLAELQAMTDRLEEATDLLADAGVDLIAFHCTAVSMLDPAAAARVVERIAAVASCPAFSTADAITQALSSFQAKNIVLISPNRQATHEREVRFMQAQGFNVVGEACMDIADARSFADIEPDAFRRLAVANRNDRADAYLLSCTAVRASEVIEAIEAELGRPVVTSNQAMGWHALRTGNITERKSGFGKLFDQH